jgi:uncharacterized protein (DUF433 family)
MPSHPAVALTWPHIDFGTDGVPFISGTTMKVVELVMAQRAHGWSPEELHFQFPFLGMNKIHAALTYFWDHQGEIEADMARRNLRVEGLKRELGISASDPLYAKLRTLKQAS